MNNVTDFFNNLSMGLTNNLNVLMLGRITSYNSNDNTATIEPLHMIPKQNVQYQPLINVPIGIFSIGGYSIKVKPKVGDVVLVLFADYDLDNILIDGKTKMANTDRTHALEDGIVLPLTINFLNNTFNCTEDLIISKEGTNSYVKIKSNGDIVLNANNIKLGENASRKIVLDNGESYTTSSKVYAE